MIDIDDVAQHEYFPFEPRIAHISLEAGLSACVSKTCKLLSQNQPNTINNEVMMNVRSICDQEKRWRKYWIMSLDSYIQRTLP